MLALIASHHVYGLLEQVKIEVLVTRGWSKVKIFVYKGLAASVEKSVDVALVPSCLFDWLELAVEIVEPLSYVSLIGFETVIPGGVIK